MRAISRFLILTFTSTWTLWALVVWTSAHRAPSSYPYSLALGGPVFVLGVFAPGLIALALTAWEGGGHAAATLLGGIGRWRVGVRYYAFALLLVPMVKLVAAGLYHAWTGMWPRFGDTHPVLLLAATLLSTLAQAGEEVGWRGYLLPRLIERSGIAVASLVVGVIWAAWHLPLFFVSGTDTNHQSFPLYTLQVTALSVILAWLYWRTGGSLLLSMLLHAAFNNMKDIVPSGGVANGQVFGFGSTLMFRLTVLVLWVVAAFVLVRLRRTSSLNTASGQIVSPRWMR